MAKKKNHNLDYAKDKTADVIMHGSGLAVPNKQWQKNLDLTPQGSDDPKQAFNPRSGKNRPCMHVKTNEYDY